MTYTLIHHTGCSTSRKGLALLQENGITPEIRKYMDAGSMLTVDELKEITEKIGAKSPRDFLRQKDADAENLSAGASDEAVYAAMAENPKLIQRPIGINDGKAVVGRPFDLLMTIA